MRAYQLRHRRRLLQLREAARQPATRGLRPRGWRCGAAFVQQFGGFVLESVRPFSIGEKRTEVLKHLFF